MFSRVCYALQLFLLVVSTSAQTQCTLSAPIPLGNNLSLQQVKNDADGTYTMKLTYTGGQSWVGIGINPFGLEKMINTDAVVGRINSDGSSSVLEYKLASDAKDASGVLPKATQTLTDATFEQVGSTSILTFTKAIDPSLVTDTALWLYAVGLPGNLRAGKHTIRGAFQLPLTSNCIAAPVASPTSAPVTPNNSLPQTTAPVHTQTTPDNNSVQTAAPVQAQNTIEGAGENLTGGDGGETEDTLNTAAGATSGDSSTTTTGFTKYFSEDPYRSLWAAHGITLSIAWGICAPLAIGASLLRKGFVKAGFTQQGLWFQIHFYLNMLTVFLTITGVILGIVAMAKQGKPHFDETHRKVRLAILALVLLQAGSACFRPALPKTPATSPTKDVDGREDAATPPGSTLAMTGHSNGKRDDELEIEETRKEAPLPPSKSQRRIRWEYSHRFVGAFVLAMSWYNCHTGIEELEHANYWETERHWDHVFWGITGGIAGTILLLTVVVRVLL